MSHDSPANDTSGSPPGLVGHLANITEQQWPLSEALRACADELASGSDRRQLLRLAAVLDRGIGLPEAVSSQAPRTPLITSLLEAGIAAGRLPQFLRSYLITQQNNQLLWRGFWASLAYPLAVALISVSLLTAVLVTIVPLFQELFRDFPVTPPLMTLSIFRLAELATAVWPFLAAGFVALTYLVLIGPHWPILTAWHYIPMLRHAARNAGAAEFCSLLAAFVECRVPLPEALKIISHSSRSYYYRSLSQQLSGRLADGIPLSEATNDPDFPPEISQLFHWSDNPDQFAMVLRNTATALASDARVRFRVFLVVLGPVMMIGIGLVVGYVMLALFIPLIKLLQQLS